MLISQIYPIFPRVPLIRTLRRENSWEIKGDGAVSVRTNVFMLHFSIAYGLKGTFSQTYFQCQMTLGK